MAMKKVDHVAKIPLEHRTNAFQYALDNDLAQIKLRCTEARYQEQVTKGDYDKAIVEHQYKINCVRAVRKAQARLWEFIQSILPEVPEPSKSSDHNIDMAGDCDVRWSTYEEMEIHPEPKRDTFAESLAKAGDPKNNPTGPGGNAQKAPEPAKA